MARLLLSPLQYRLLDILAREGGMTFAALYDRTLLHSRVEAGAALRAAQDLYDLSFVDVKREAYLDALDPADLARAYKHLDEFNAPLILARGGAADPYWFSASHLGLAELDRPGYAERAVAGPEPPTLPFP